MKSLSPLMVLALGTLQLAGPSAEAARQSLVCRRSQGKASVSLAIALSESGDEGRLAGRYRYESIWSGSFPTDTQESGDASGALSEGERGIEARFDFTAFGVPSFLEVHQSVGRVVIGSGSGQSVDPGLQCSLQ